MDNNNHLAEMVDLLSHELRTPLISILGYSELLEKSENLTETELSHVDKISKGGKQLLNLINRIIDKQEVRSGLLSSKGVNSGQKRSYSNRNDKSQHKNMSLVKASEEYSEHSTTSYSPKALIVDDLVMNRTLARIMLETRNFRILEAENGKEGVYLFKKSSPDVVLMDISMPEMNGVEAMHKIRSFTSTISDDIPIIAVTAGGHAGSRTELMKQGFSEYLQKPYREKELVDKISMFIPVPDQKLSAVSEA